MPVLQDEQTDASGDVKFTGPWRYIVWMALFTAAVLAIGIMLIEPLTEAFQANIAINGLILGVLVIGVLYTYAQALGIWPAARWLVRFRSSEHPGSLPTPPAMIAPMASMMGAADGRMRISAGSVRTVLDSVGARMSEAGAFTRYFGRLLIFLGLLGTFWGLLQVVSDVGAAVRAVTESTTGGEADVLRLMSAIEDPIQGMGMSPASFTFPLPLTPPEQRTGPIGAGLTPAESSPGRNGFESVAVQRQAPVAAHPGVHIHEPLPQVGEISIRNSLALGHASQGQRLRFSVMQHGPGGESIQQARQPSPAAFLRMVLKHQDRVVFRCMRQPGPAGIPGQANETMQEIVTGVGIRLDVVQQNSGRCLKLRHSR